jgi:tellurite resistance protein
MNHAENRATPLAFLHPGWFAIVMGLAGLALAWHRAAGPMGEAATAVSLVLAALAAAVFLLLATASLLRWQRHRAAWHEDLRHPVRHAFVAAVPIAALLLVTLAVAHGTRGGAVPVAWWTAALAQLGVTLWVLSRWWRGGPPPAAAASPTATAPPPGLQWPVVTPVLLIPIVGNVLVPLAGLPLGQAGWSAAQFGMGLLMWPVVLALLLARVAVAGPWPERLLPTGFILVAPPAVVGLALLQFGAPVAAAWALWGIALFMLLWAATLARRIAALPFALPHWAMSFPLAAFAALTLRLADDAAAAAPMRLLGVAALALASLVIAALALATLRGLRDGSLLAPEPVAALQPSKS